MISMVVFTLFSIVGNIGWLTNTGNLVTITNQLAKYFREEVQETEIIACGQGEQK